MSIFFIIFYECDDAHADNTLYRPLRSTSILYAMIDHGRFALSNTSMEKFERQGEICEFIFEFDSFLDFVFFFSNFNFMIFCFLFKSLTLNTFTCGPSTYRKSSLETRVTFKKPYIRRGYSMYHIPTISHHPSHPHSFQKLNRVYKSFVESINCIQIR